VGPTLEHVTYRPIKSCRTMSRIKRHRPTVQTSGMVLRTRAPAIVSGNLEQTPLRGSTCYRVSVQPIFFQAPTTRKHVAALPGKPICSNEAGRD
jgi:hypothetical protein